MPHVCVFVPQLPQAIGLVWPGAHTPVHAPVAVTHVRFAHAEPLLCQLPVESHVWGCWPLHVTEPSAHATQAPFKHVGVGLVQGGPTSCHPVEPPHCCGCVPLQRTAFFVHVPHVPLLLLHTGMLPEHTAPMSCHCPSEPQFWGCEPLQ